MFEILKSMSATILGSLLESALLDVLLTLLLFVVFAVLVIRFSRYPRRFLGWLLVSGVFLFVFGFVRLAPGSPLFDPGDGNNYLEWGYEITEAFQGLKSWDEIPTIWPGKGFWSLIIGIIGLSVQKPVLLPLMVNVIAVLATVMVMQKTFCQVTETKSHRYVLSLALINPGIIMWGPTHMRENFGWLGLALVGLALSRRGQARFRTQLLTAATGFALIVATRDDWGTVLMVLIVGVGLVVPPVMESIAQHSFSNFFSLRFAAVLGFLTLLVAASWLFLESNLVTRGESVSSEVMKRTLSVSQADAQSAISKELPIAARAASGLLGPFPYELRLNLVFLLVGASTIYFGFLLVLVLLRIRHESVESVSTIVSLLIIATVAAGILGVLLGNYGALVRIRTGLGILLIPYAAAKLQELHTRWPRGSSMT